MAALSERCLHKGCQPCPGWCAMPHCETLLYFEMRAASTLVTAHSVSLPSQKSFPHRLTPNKLLVSVCLRFLAMASTTTITKFSSRTKPHCPRTTTSCALPHLALSGRMRSGMSCDMLTAHADKIISKVGPGDEQGWVTGAHQEMTMGKMPIQIVSMGMSMRVGVLMAPTM